jgi:phage major head subunit gpT-like protein
MSAKGLGSRAIIGRYYRQLEIEAGASWVNDVSNLFDSDQESETYKWLGQVPAFREWIGGRQAKGFSENGITIENKHFEATLEVLVREMRRDKTGQVMARIDELAARTVSHWASLLSTLILNGPSTVCYDGQFFFDTDHTEGDSGAQDNDIQVDISGLAASVHGVVTAPSVEEMQGSIVAGIQQILKFKDNQGEPYNEMAKAFLVMVPVSLFFPAVAAVNLQGPARAFASQTGLDALVQAGLSIKVQANTRLDGSWTDEFAVFRTDSAIKPLIRQEETPVVMKAIAEGSELEFKEDRHEYGVDAWRNVGYGLWQGSCLVTMV